jgi:selT/selW/selH-like putative selenoprotein
VSGAKGQFDVLVDGDLVFSKQREGRFPEHDEILTRLG